MSTGPEMMKGRRLPGGFLRHGRFRPGDYQVVTAGSENVLGLWVVPPGGGNLTHVTDRGYTEHRDGTVSVVGTIVASGWEGFLEHGVWREAGLTRGFRGEEETEAPQGRSAPAA